MRKLLLAITVLFASVGLTLAAPVRLVKFDEKTKEAVVKSGKKGEEVEKTIKVSDKTKFTDEDDKEVKYEDAVKKMTGDKAVKRIDLTEEDGKATAIKFMAAKKKNPQ